MRQEKSLLTYPWCYYDVALVATRKTEGCKSKAEEKMLQTTHVLYDFALTQYPTSKTTLKMIKMMFFPPGVGFQSGTGFQRKGAQQHSVMAPMI